MDKSGTFDAVRFDHSALLGWINDSRRQARDVDVPDHLDLMFGKEALVRVPDEASTLHTQ